MKIGLYGMPTSGKTYILEKIDFMEVIAGSTLLRQHDPLFDERDEQGRDKTRSEIATLLMEKESFIMDGHYAFGDEIAFTEQDGKLYDAFIYLYINPSILKERMMRSSKNRKYASYDIEKWQLNEINELRAYCHKHNKDFYVIDHPTKNTNVDSEIVVQFIYDIFKGFSCHNLAERIALKILSSAKSDTISLFDGDKTLTIQDTSNTVFGYKTQLYDNNFYTGYQSWLQARDFTSYHFDELTKIPVDMNSDVLAKLNKNSFIITSGHNKVWKFISSYLKIPFFNGPEMSADTKFFVTKILQKNGKRVIAYGDGMNDYFMLKQADEGHLIVKPDGSISRSLKNMSLEGIKIDRTKER